MVDWNHFPMVSFDEEHQIYLKKHPFSWEFVVLDIFYWKT